MAHFYHHHQHVSHAAPVFSPPMTHHQPHARPRPRPVPAHATRHHPVQASPRTHATSVADPILAYHTQPSNAPLEFDLSLPPSQILISHGPSRSSYSGLSPRHLSPPAISPITPHLRITCAHLPWTIDVYPAARSGSSVVTVGDVLESIFVSLRHRVSEAEWHAISPEMQMRVRNAYLRRCKRQPSLKEREHEERQGLRRIDWLSKNTVFQGITPGKSRDHWVMHVRQGEKTVKFWAGS